MIFTFEQVASLIAFIGALGGVAWAIVAWVQGRFDRRDDEQAKVRSEEREDAEAKLGALQESLEKQLAAVMERLDEDRDIVQKAIELTHTRISNARKEMVELRHYEKDIRRLEDAIQRIAEAIEKLATSIRHDMNSQRQTVGNLVAIQDQLNIRIKTSDDRITQLTRPLPAAE